ncbi:MAG: tetratricopeptide repeat protein, partial [Patescibacteria group bacterium]
MRVIEHRSILFTGLLALACLVIFFPVLSHNFVRWDDFALIVENPLVRSFSSKIFWTFDPELNIPLTLLTFQVETAIAGTEPFLFHLVNLLLHIANAILAFAFLKRLFKDDLIAFGGALLFALHPIQTEAVSWVSARKELLMTFFFLGSLLLVMHDERTRGNTGKRGSSIASLSSIASISFFLLALLSKVTAITLPVVLLLIDWHEGKNLRQTIIRLWPYWILSVLFGAIAIIGRSDPLTLLTPFQTILLAFRSFTFYVQQFFLPLHFSAIYEASSPLALTNPGIALSIIIVIFLCAAVWLLRRRWLEGVLGFLFFAVTIAPSFLAYAKAGDVTLAADRYAYLPVVGLVILVAGILSVILKNKSRWEPAILIAAALLLSIKTFDQTHVWQSTGTLFASVLQIYPTSHVALNNLGFVALNEGRVDEAIALSEAALKEKPEYPDALVNLGAAYGRKGRLDDAERVLRRAIGLRPLHIQALYNLAGVHLTRGEW